MQDLKLVKDLAFGDHARSQVLTGVEKLTNAVGSTLGASGKCVIIEDGNGVPQITKDGVTCLLYTSPSPRDCDRSRMPSSA